MQEKNMLITSMQKLIKYKNIQQYNKDIYQPVKKINNKYLNHQVKMILKKLFLILMIKIHVQDIYYRIKIELRKVSHKLLVQLLYNNNNLKERFCQLMGVSMFSGKVILNSKVLSTVKHDNLVQIIKLLKKKNDHLSQLNLISSQKSMKSRNSNENQYEAQHSLPLSLFWYINVQDKKLKIQNVMKDANTFEISVLSSLQQQFYSQKNIFQPNKFDPLNCIFGFLMTQKKSIQNSNSNSIKVVIKPGQDLLNKNNYYYYKTSTTQGNQEMQIKFENVQLLKPSSTNSSQNRYYFQQKYDKNGSQRNSLDAKNGLVVQKNKNYNTQQGNNNYQRQTQYYKNSSNKNTEGRIKTSYQPQNNQYLYTDCCSTVNKNNNLTLSAQLNNQNNSFTNRSSNKNNTLNLNSNSNSNSNNHHKKSNYDNNNNYLNSSINSSTNKNNKDSHLYYYNKINKNTSNNNQSISLQNSLDVKLMNSLDNQNNYMSNYNQNKPVSPAHNYSKYSKYTGLKVVSNTPTNSNINTNTTKNRQSFSNRTDMIKAKITNITLNSHKNSSQQKNYQIQTPTKSYLGNSINSKYDNTRNSFGLKLNSRPSTSTNKRKINLSFQSEQNTNNDQEKHHIILGRGNNTHNTSKNQSKSKYSNLDMNVNGSIMKKYQQLKQIK